MNVRQTFQKQLTGKGAEGQVAVFADTEELTGSEDLLFDGNRLLVRGKQSWLMQMFKTERTPPFPPGAIPLKEALGKVGLTSRQVKRVREGRSRTGMPPMHKARSGRIYCLPEELASWSGVQ